MSTPALTFEDYGIDNGARYWWASDFAKMLGYSNWKSFQGVINRAIQSCMAAKIVWEDDFFHTQRDKVKDYKLTRFACYMAAMNADSKKPTVGRAQVYFANQVEKIDLYLEGTKDVDRLQYRDEIKHNHKALNSAAQQGGVVDFGLFHDAGYKGMYNRSIQAVKQRKNIPLKADHFDFMGRTELAANLFRITLTEEKLKRNSNLGQQTAMDVHQKVGQQVRKIVKDNTGKNPEDLRTERKLGEVKKELKKATKKLKKRGFS